MQETKRKLFLDVNEKPKSKLQWGLLSFQHVFAMFGATILVPILTGLPISVALFTSGVGTLIYILCTKAKAPVYLGSSFAYIGAVIVAANVIKDESGNIISTGSYAPALTGLFVVGVVYVIIAFVIKYTGKKWLEKLLPPIIVGPMIILIGLSLSSVAIGMAGLDGNGTWQGMVAAGVALLVTVLVALKAKGFFKIIPFLCGIVAGYITVVILDVTTIPDVADRMINFSNLVTVLQNPGQWFALPNFMVMGWEDQTLFGNVTMYKINFAAALSIAPLAFVTACEHIGDHQVLGKIIDRNLIQDPGLDKTLLGDGLATSFAALVGGPANTTYGENTGVVGMTRVASVWVTGVAAVIAILLSFINVFTTLIGTIPTAVMGGISIILYGFIASNGLKVLIDNQVNLAKTKNLIVVAAMLVIGLGGGVIQFGNFQIYGLALAVIVGVLLNSFLPNKESKVESD